jgi:hypothetical protein
MWLAVNLRPISTYCISFQHPQSEDCLSKSLLADLTVPLWITSFLGNFGSPLVHNRGSLHVQSFNYTVLPNGRVLEITKI